MTRFYVDEGGEYLGGFDGAEPPAGAIEVPSAPGDARQMWSGSEWVAIPAVVSQDVAMWQARDILIEDDLLDDVYAYFETIGDPKEKRKAISKFETSSRVYRNDPLVLYVIPLMGKSEADIDQMFIRAAAL